MESIKSNISLGLLANSFKIGGAERIVLEIARELNNKGFAPHILSLERTEYPEYKVEPAFNHICLSDSNGIQPFYFKFFSLLILAVRLKRYVRANGLAIVQSHTYRSNYVNVISKLLGSEHEVQIVNHSTFSRYRKEGIKGFISLMLVGTLYKRADKVILLSEGMKFDFEKNFKNRFPVRIINNFVDIELINHLKNEIVDEFLLEKKYLIVVGRLIPLKRCEDIINAFQELNRLNPELELLFLGDGVLRDDLIIEVDRLGIKAKVHFMGSVTNPYKYMYNAFLFICASENEGFPVTHIEAMACGCPVLSSDCFTGPREIMAPGTDYTRVLTNTIEIADYGVLFPVGNRELLKEGVLMFDDLDFREKFKESSLKRALDFSKNKILNLYMEMLDKSNDRI